MLQPILLCLIINLRGPPSAVEVNGFTPATMWRKILVLAGGDSWAWDLFFLFICLKHSSSLVHQAPWDPCWVGTGSPARAAAGWAWALSSWSTSGGRQPTVGAGVGDTPSWSSGFESRCGTSVLADLVQLTGLLWDSASLSHNAGYLLPWWLSVGIKWHYFRLKKKITWQIHQALSEW